MIELKNKLISEFDINLDDVNLLKVALTHPSYGENHITYNYQRLEFLGDSIIKAILSEWLYNMYPEEDEGFYTENRIKMEEGTYLQKVSKRYLLDKYVIKGNSLDLSVSIGVLSDLFESLVGCIFLQNGYKRTSTFVIESCTKDLISLKSINYMKEVNEYFQLRDKNNDNKLSYIQDDSGEWICFINDENQQASAYGKSKKEAKKEASRLFYNMYIKE